ncbi:MAG: DUF5025 domain-containing protein [Tannerellaceae bacterium]|nr:DUF5025 domain-containing protein [Tannerellaceae bacterium]
MKRIDLICFVCLIAMSFSACSDDDKPVEEINPKEHLWWGYFDGAFDGTLPEDDLSVSFENERFNNDRISSLFQYNSRPGRYGRDQIGIKFINIMYIKGSTPDNGSNIEMSISGLVPDTKYITKPNREPGWDDLYCSTIALIRNYPDGSRINYVPSEHNPFEIEVFDVKWNSPYLPVIEATLRGTLYRQDALQQDSIIVNATLGAGEGFNGLDLP